MARKASSRSTAAAASSTTTTFHNLTNTAAFSAQSLSPNAYPIPSATTVAGGAAPADNALGPSSLCALSSSDARVSSSETATRVSSARKRSQPRSKNHGRFPCSIPGCFAVANHLSSMCRHKWGHLPQRLLPACRGHLPNGAACPVRYQGRADTMKRHWLTHHTSEGPWVPDRYPPFEDLWRLVQEGEIVLSPPSKYAYDSPGPDQLSTASATARTSGGEASGTGTGRRNSVGTSAKPYSLSKITDALARDEIAGRSRSHSYSGGATRHLTDSRGSRDVRFSRGNTKPWRVSDPTQDMVGDEDEDEIDELDAGTVDGDLDIEMENATSDVSYSPSHHSLRHSPAYPHSARSQRSPRSPASVRSFPAEQDQIEVDIHVPYATIPPITPLTPGPTEAITRYPLHPAANYPVLQPSNFREHTITYNNSYLRHHGYSKSKDSGVLGLLALSASRGAHALENMNPNDVVLAKQSKPGPGAVGIVGEYVYGHGDDSPPGSAYTPASIPHSELSLVSHPPHDSILPSSPPPSSGDLPPVQDHTEGADAPYPPMRVSPESDRPLLPFANYEMWHTHGHTMARPFTVASH